MHCFSKIPRFSLRIPQTSVLKHVLHSFSKKVLVGEDEKTYVTFSYLNAKTLAMDSDIPKSDDYQLREMLKQGFVPNQIPVSNLLSSNDSLDIENLGLLDNFVAAAESEKLNNVLPKND